MPGPIVYLHGFASGPTSGKARYFHERFAEEGIDLLVPDLSDGNFQELTITGQLNVIERLAGGKPAVLIGSSLGGYLAALYAARFPEVHSLILLAPAFAFPTRWAHEMDPVLFEQWRTAGTIPVYHYSLGQEVPLGFQLIEDAAQYEDYPEVRQPTLVFHGIQDTAVPYSYSEAFARGRSNVAVHILKSDHQLLDVKERIWREIREFVLGR